LSSRGHTGKSIAFYRKEHKEKVMLKAENKYAKASMKWMFENLVRLKFQVLTSPNSFFAFPGATNVVW